jgi:hypothetical protein
MAIVKFEHFTAGGAVENLGLFGHEIKADFVEEV